MTILYFYQYFGTPKGGWSTRVYEMCRRWVAAGHRVRVVTSLYDKSDLASGGIYKRQLVDGIEVFVINVRLSNKHGIGRRIYSFIVYALVATYLGLRLSTDVIVASSGPITIGFPALISKWLRRKPMVFEVRDLWPDGAVAFGILRHPLLVRLAYWFEALCYRNAALVVACSPGIEHSINRRFPEVKTINIPNAADLDLFRYSTVASNGALQFADSKLFVYTGTLGLIDDCRQIVNAAEVLQRRGRADIQIVMIGDGKERMMLEAEAKSKGLQHIYFLGLMPKNALINYVRKARASILTVKPIPFMDHCSPNKMFDAFAAGIPIIQTTQGWIKELVETEQCGLNIPANDPGAFADAMEQLADDEVFFASCAKNAARLGEMMFNRDKLADKMLNAIVEIYEQTAPYRR